MLTDSGYGSRVAARAPLRLGFGGGGSDVSPYCDRFGGCVLNATIDMFVHCQIELREDGKVQFVAFPYEQQGASATRLHKAVYRRIVSQFLDGACLPITVSTRSDAPAGSGLGSSSTLVVAMIMAYRELLDLPLTDYQVADLAYVIERIDAGQAGGRQDQYAAAFGGLNFIEFSDRHAAVNPLHVRSSTLRRLEAMLLLYRTGISRDSARIITEQSRRCSGHTESLQAMHAMKRDATVMRDALLRDDLSTFCATMRHSWDAKKRTAAGISNQEIDRIHATALAAGASAGKVSGAGGGGFLFFLVPPERRQQVVAALSQEAGTVQHCSLTAEGAQAWRL